MSAQVRRAAGRLAELGSWNCSSACHSSRQQQARQARSQYCQGRSATSHSFTSFSSSVRKKAIPLLAHHAEILAEIVLDDPSGLHAASLQEIWSFQQDYGGLSCRI